MTICILDTSIFCELLNVPGRAADAARFHGQLRQKLDERETLLLPLIAVYETGNHIGHGTDGNARQGTAGRFVSQVQAAISGTSPFIMTPLADRESLSAWIIDYPRSMHRCDAHGRGLGFGDFTIIKEWERQCRLHSGHRVYIWSLDELLRSYDRGPG